MQRILKTSIFEHCQLTHFMGIFQSWMSSFLCHCVFQCLPEIFSQKQLNWRMSSYSKYFLGIFCANWFWCFFNFAYQIQYWHAPWRIHVYWKPWLKIPQINPYAYTTKYNRSSINIKRKDTVVSPVQWPQWMHSISNLLGIGL